MRAAEVSRSTLHRYFTDRQALMDRARDEGAVAPEIPTTWAVTVFYALLCSAAEVSNQDLPRHVAAALAMQSFRRASRPERDAAPVRAGRRAQCGASESGTTAGRSHVLSTVTATPLPADASSDVMMSSTWYATSPLARTGTPGGVTARSATP